jgi:PST family polysaccharide transporter
LKNKFFRNIISLGFIQIVNFVFPLITVPYVSRVIGPEGYGAIGYATAFVSYFSLLINYGFELTGTRRISQDGTKLNTIVSEIFYSRLILFSFASIIFFVLAFISKAVEKEFFITTILFIGSFSNVLSPQYIYQGNQDLTIYSKLNFIKGLLNVLFVLLLIKNKSDYVILPILTVCFSFSINLILFLNAKRKYNIRLILIPFKRPFELLFEERTVFFSSLFISLYTTANVLIMGQFVSPKELGFYTACQSLLLIVSSVISYPISVSMYPYIGSSFASSFEKGLESVRRILPVIFYILLICCSFLFLLAPILIDIIFGTEYFPAKNILRILSFAPLLIAVSNVYGIQVMLNLNKDKMFFNVTISGSIIGIFLGIFLSSTFGAIGAAFNSLIVEFIIVLAMHISLSKSGVSLIFKEYFRPISVFNYLKKSR